MASDSNIKLEEEFNRTVLKRLQEQFESIARIPFISSGKLFRKFFEIDGVSTPMEMISADKSFDKALADSELKSNPFMAERRLTESVPPKNTRMTLQGE